MKRKVIQIAGSTQLLSLPRKWALRNGVKKGDELEVLEQGSQLMISLGDGKNVEKKGKINYTTAKSFIKRPLRMLYKLGYTEVEIHFTDPGVVPLVQNTVQEMLGFEVVHQSHTSCVVKNVAEPMDTEFDTIFRRLFLTVLSVAREQYTAIQSKQFDVFNHAETLEHTIDKLSLFCERLLNTKGYHDREKTCFIYQTTCMLEEIGDWLLEIARIVSQNHPSFSPEVLKFFANTIQLFEHFHDMYFKFDLDKLMEFKKTHVRLKNEAIELLSMRKGAEAKALHYMLDTLQTLHNMTMFLV